jgi:hypothetical protein
MRDPLVTPAVGDVIEGRDADALYRWTVTECGLGMVRALFHELTPDGAVLRDETGDVPIEDWSDWTDFTDVRVVSTARDPLVNPEPGDVVRAMCDGVRAAIVVLDVTEGIVCFSVCWFIARQAAIYEETLDEWRDWSAWADVAVLS